MTQIERLTRIEKATQEALHFALAEMERARRKLMRHERRG